MFHFREQEKDSVGTSLPPSSSGGPGESNIELMSIGVFILKTALVYEEGTAVGVLSLKGVWNEWPSDKRMLSLTL